MSFYGLIKRLRERLLHYYHGLTPVLKQLEQGALQGPGLLVQVESWTSVDDNNAESGPRLSSLYTCRIKGVDVSVRLHVCYPHVPPVFKIPSRLEIQDVVNDSAGLQTWVRRSVGEFRESECLAWMIVRVDLIVSGKDNVVFNASSAGHVNRLVKSGSVDSTVLDVDEDTVMAG